MQCPSTHPFIFNNGQSCCWFYARKISPGISGLSETPLAYTDVLEYCDNFVHPDLAGGKKKLRSNMGDFGKTIIRQIINYVYIVMNNAMVFL